MSVNVQENAPKDSGPFVDQLPNGPGVSKINSSDPAAPLYQLLAKMRTPVTLRDLMIHPVRVGYIGQEKPIDPAELPKSAAELYPRWRCLRRPAASAAKSTAHPGRAPLRLLRVP